MQAEPEHVRAELEESSGGRVQLPVTEVLHHLYRSDILSLNREDLASVEAHIAAAGPDLVQLIAAHTFHDRPHESLSQCAPGHLDRLRDVLTSDATLLPRPVIVFRGEHPSTSDPAFADTALNACPGSLLPRGDLPLSTSLDPAAAALIDFSGIGVATTPRTGHEGWVLAITTDHVLYTGARSAGSGHRNPLAEEEKEALIYAPMLRVTGVTDSLITSDRWAAKRAQVIHAVPEYPEAPS